MSNDVETAPTSIQARIAALNLNQVARVPSGPPPSYHQAVDDDQTSTAGRRAKPPPPPLPKRSANHRSQSADNPPVVSNGVSSSELASGNLQAKPPIPPTPKRPERWSEEQRPSLPPRRPSSVATDDSILLSPKLPPRRPSSQSIRKKDSAESLASVASGFSAASARTSFSAASRSTTSRIRAPEYDPGALPPLPERRSKTREEEPPPPQLPLRPTVSAPHVMVTRTNGHEEQQEDEEDVPPPLPIRPRLSSRPNKSGEMPPPMPSRNSTVSPPPVPLGSRPSLAALQASKPRSTSSSSTATATATATATSNSTVSGCMTCRDFSGPDNHAARFPRQSIPSTDIAWIARQLTSPFSNRTDKARALFTWLHHNIEYNTVDFFNNNVKSSSPSSTIASGLAVCEGYAALFTALASAAGLESIVVTGHGKGYGFDRLGPNAPIPPRNAGGHAWNAVRLDNDEWKLLDACWGAGHVQGKNMPYVKKFSPERFTQSNEEFGRDHFPADSRYFFRLDGRALSWEEYVLSDAGEEPPTVYGDWDLDHGLRKESLQPASKAIPVSTTTADQMVRFIYEKKCPHWDNERQGSGKMYLPLLEINGYGGGSDDGKKLLLQSDGFHWWIDVPRDQLGRPGQQVKLICMNKMDGRDGRGLTADEYENFMRRPTGGWQWVGMAEWDLV